MVPKVFWIILEIILVGGGGLQLVRRRCSVNQMIHASEAEEDGFVTADLQGKEGKFVIGENWFCVGTCNW